MARYTPDGQVIRDAAEKDPKAAPVITRKRKKLAKLIAAGYTQQAAYEAAYNVKSGSANAHRQNGHQVAKLPEVQELIKAYEEELVPLGDIRQEQETILSHLKALAFNALDEKTRVTASVHLYNLLETHRETEERIRAKRPVSQSRPAVDAVVTELLQLAESQPAIEMETETTAASEIGETATETDSPEDDPVE